ncbi:MAG: hypothetical protein ACRDG4_05555, partial [Chloroflexota bacterium]
MELVARVAEAVLYEGYLLFPYRRSAIKNQQRWQFGGVYPRSYSEASGGNDPWSRQTQCLVVGNAETKIEIRPRFLQVVDRRPAQLVDGALRPVDTLRVGEQVYQAWEEAIERTIPVAGTEGGTALRLGDLLASCRSQLIDIAAGSAEEPLLDAAGVARGALIREWQALHGIVEVTAEPAMDGEPDQAPADRLYRLTAQIRNTTPWQSSSKGVDPRPRYAPARQAFISTHTILHVEAGEFISLLDPPPEYA